MMAIHYLDNAATTKTKFYNKNYDMMWFNSNVDYAHNEQYLLDGARKTIKECLGVNSGYVLFTRCATESIEWLCKQFSVDECWCSSYEHDSVYNACDRNVLTTPTGVQYNLQEYSLYCHQLVNQLTGTCFDIQSIHDEWVTKPNQFFGVDLTAAIGHVELPKNMDEYCDALWFSGHKFHAEKGIGAIWISDKLFKWLDGKSDPANNYGLIHGTVNIAGALALADAMESTVNYNMYDMNHKHDHLISHMLKLLRTYDIKCDGLDNDIFTPAINLLTLDNMNADALQQFLSTKGVYVGLAESACAESHDYRVAKAFGLTNEQAEHSIRVSFCEDTTTEDVVALVDGIKEFESIYISKGEK